MCVMGAKKVFTETKEFKTVLNFYVCCLIQKLCFPILQYFVKLMSNRLILFNDFMQKEGPLTKCMQ